MADNSKKSLLEKKDVGFVFNVRSELINTLVSNNFKLFLVFSKFELYKRLIFEKVKVLCVLSKLLKEAWFNLKKLETLFNVKLLK